MPRPRGRVLRDDGSAFYQIKLRIRESRELASGKPQRTDAV